MQFSMSSPQYVSVNFDIPENRVSAWTNLIETGLMLFADPPEQKRAGASGDELSALWRFNPLSGPEFLQSPVFEAGQHLLRSRHTHRRGNF